jgi:hypothetical protein
MSFVKFSSPDYAPAKKKVAQKPAAAPTVDQPAEELNKTPPKVTPETQS